MQAKKTSALWAAVLAAGQAFAAAPTGAAAPWAAADKPSTQPAPGPPLEPIVYPTPEMLTSAGRTRLRAEREILAAEFALRAALDPADIRRVVAEMERGAKDTVQDNFERMAKAFAAFHEEFRRAWGLYQAGRYAEVAAILEPYQQEKKKHTGPMPAHLRLQSYQYAIAKMLFGECSGRMGNIIDAVLSYEAVAMRHSGNLSFGATAMFRAAQIYENTGRAHYCLPFYKGLARHYADLLCDEQALAVRNRILRLTAENDPYRLILRKSADSQKRLARADVSTATQLVQEELMAALNAAMAMPEEYPHWFEHCEVISMGAETGKLREQAPPRLMGPNDMPPLAGSDDWGKLRPRERQQLLQLFQETYPQRYRDMLEAYYRTMSKAETEHARNAP